jgi:hypothetical protein
MSEEMTIGQKIRRLKPAQGFMVYTEEQRQTASRQGKDLKADGAINFTVVTRRVKPGGPWQVAAFKPA